MWSSCATILFLTHFDAICDLLLNRRSATWNLPINFHEICYGGGMNEFCLTKDQTSPKSPPPPHPSQVLPPSLEADANHVWIVDQLRNKKHR